MAMVVTNAEIPKIPIRFKEEWDNESVDVKAKWRAVIREELLNMEKRKVWSLSQTNKSHYKTCWLD